MDGGAGGSFYLLLGGPQSSPARRGPPGRGPRALLQGAEGTLPDQHRAAQQISLSCPALALAQQIGS